MKKIYLDNSATTPVDESILKKITNLLKKEYENPSSLYSSAKKLRQEIETARKEISNFINADPKEIIFTSGGTESNNALFFGLDSNEKHIITSKIEHPSVLEPLKELEKRGCKITYLNVDEDGLINLNELKNAINEKTILVSIMHVNNEIGSINNLEEIGKICKDKNIFFHSDCVQSFGKLEIDVKKFNLDAISVSGHKLNSLKGTGFLYLSKKIKSKIKPVLFGGGQEFNLRSGTENTLGILALSEAIKISRSEEKTKKIRDYLAQEILKIPKTRINGPSLNSEKRIYNNLNISFYGIEGESLLLLLDKKGIEVSTGSACSSHKLEESNVLKSINVSDLYIHGSIRITLDTRKNFQIIKKEADFIVEQITNSVNKLREISPFKI